MAHQTHTNCSQQSGTVYTVTPRNCSPSSPRHHHPRGRGPRAHSRQACPAPPAPTPAAPVPLVSTTTVSRPACALTCAAQHQPARSGVWAAGSRRRTRHLNEGPREVRQLWSQESLEPCGTRARWLGRAAVARWPWHPALESRPGRTGLGCPPLVGQGGGDRLLNTQQAAEERRAPRRGVCRCIEFWIL